MTMFSFIWRAVGHASVDCDVLAKLKVGEKENIAVAVDDLNRV